MKEMKRDPVGVVCVDDYVQSSWQYGEWLRAAETLLAVWNLFSSAAVLWVLVSSSERCVFIVCWSMYYVCVMHNRHTLVVDEEVKKPVVLKIPSVMLHILIIGFSFWKALTDRSIISLVKPKNCFSGSRCEGPLMLLWEHYVYSHRMSSECWVRE